MLTVCFYNDTATTAIYTLSLHDALPISVSKAGPEAGSLGYVPLKKIPSAASASSATMGAASRQRSVTSPMSPNRSEEHTSELQSLRHLVCRLLLEKKKKKTQQQTTTKKY